MCKFYRNLEDISDLENCYPFALQVVHSLAKNHITSIQTYLLYLHEVTKALLTEDIFEEDQVLFMVGIWVELRGEQGQSLMQPCRP